VPPVSRLQFCDAVCPDVPAIIKFPPWAADKCSYEENLSRWVLAGAWNKPIERRPQVLSCLTGEDYTVHRKRPSQICLNLNIPRCGQLAVYRGVAFEDRRPLRNPQTDHVVRFGKGSSSPRALSFPSATRALDLPKDKRHWAGWAWQDTGSLGCVAGRHLRNAGSCWRFTANNLFRDRLGVDIEAHVKRHYSRTSYTPSTRETWSSQRSGLARDTQKAAPVLFLTLSNRI